MQSDRGHGFVWSPPYPYLFLTRSRAINWKHALPSFRFSHAAFLVHVAVNTIYRHSSQTTSVLQKDERKICIFKTLARLLLTNRATYKIWNGAAGRVKHVPSPRGLHTRPTLIAIGQTVQYWEDGPFASRFSRSSELINRAHMTSYLTSSFTVHDRKIQYCLQSNTP